MKFPCILRQIAFSNKWLMEILRIEIIQRNDYMIQFVGTQIADGLVHETDKNVLDVDNHSNGKGLKWS